MFNHTRLFLGAALLVAACSASAATQTTVGVDASRAARVNTVMTERLQMLQKRSAEDPAKSANSVNSAIPGLPRPNNLTPYPPSCLADPLPDQSSGPTYSQNVSLAAFNTNTQQVDSTEIVNITIWRVACSTPVGSNFQSATLMRINRNSNSTTIYPLFPAIRVSQGSVGFGDSDYPENIARTAIEPNTWISDVQVDTPIINDTTLVLENYDSNVTSVFDFNNVFSVRFDNLFASNNLFYIDVPVYNPTAQTYPAAFQNLPISGYMTSNWYDPTASGEGIALQIFDHPTNADRLVVSFTWTAFDPSGLPFWLFGQVDIPRGATSATSGMFYRTGGGLGGNSGAASAPIPWGSATVSFPDCNNMTFSFASNSGLPAGIPTGNGTRDWIRIANINGLGCQ
ncbi:MAG TPA: hypothetical protein VFN25_07240 [Dokdonella sp.]|uniref:hypothetical protein n=1 Tax=Dokdonella sp. TaxID=2291710 RepID=UPI002D7F7F67|nr:hypothetical protein [Dokdonella sp.]HET9032684.1 hypothetical protein [Dokdonella sp.]